MIEPRQRAAALLLLTLAAPIAAASCGGAADMAEAKSVGQAPTLESALAALDLAENQVAVALGGPPPPPAAEPPPAASALPVAPGVAAAEARDRAAGAGRAAPTAVADAAHKGAASPQPVAASPCTAACTALASMERAADHLCGLAGAGDSRCTAARERVKTAGARVHSACPACAK